MNKIKLIIIFGITAIIVVLFFTISLMLGRGKAPEKQNGTPMPTIEQINTSELYITSIIPADTTNIYLPVQPVQITFTQSISPDSLKYQAIPTSNSFVTQGKTPNSLIISPTTFWVNGTTTITIFKTTTSAGGLGLKNPQSYILKTAAPTIPPNLEGAY